MYSETTINTDINENNFYVFQEEWPENINSPCDKCPVKSDPSWNGVCLCTLGGPKIIY